MCRIREDTAKYLLNLDVNSAYYDPKTRSMRENPNPDKSVDEISFAGDNFVRFSGDAKDFTKLSVFSWDVSSIYCLEDSRLLLDSGCGSRHRSAPGCSALPSRVHLPRGAAQEGSSKDEA